MSYKTTSIKYGIITGVFLIGYFSLLGLLGYIKSPVYSIFNALICALGIFLAITEQSNSDTFSYKVGFKTGVTTGVIATIIFTAFIAIFAANSEGFLSGMAQEISIIQINYVLLVLVTAILGLVSIYIITYLLMRYFKKSWNLH